MKELALDGTKAYKNMESPLGHGLHLSPTTEQGLKFHTVSMYRALLGTVRYVVPSVTPGRTEQYTHTHTYISIYI